MKMGLIVSKSSVDIWQYHKTTAKFGKEKPGSLEQEIFHGGGRQRGVGKHAQHLHRGISNKPTLVIHRVHPLIKEQEERKDS